MKTFIILGLILTTVNSSFLRELNSEATKALTVSAVTFVADCSVDTEVTITATTGQTDYETVQGTTTITGKLSSGVTANDISLTGGIATKKTTDSAADGKIEFYFLPLPFPRVNYEFLRNFQLYFHLFQALLFLPALL